MGTGADDEDVEKGTNSEKKGFCRRCFGTLWKTSTDQENPEDQEEFLKNTLKELLIYSLFLTLLCIIAFARSGVALFYFTKVMMDLFLESEDVNGNSFGSIRTVGDFWKFAKGPLLDGLYWEKWYNDKPLPPSLKGYIYYESKLLGVPRIRQIRVRTNSCEVFDDFKNFIRDCYSMYSTHVEDTAPFGLYFKGSNDTAWIHQTEEELGGIDYWGRMNTYQGSGYVKDLFSERAMSEEALAELEDNLWIRRGTSAVFIHFTVYNGNVNLFCVITLVVEFPATGGAYTTSSFHTVQLLRYQNEKDYFILACEILFFIFILYYMIEELIEISVTGTKYFIDFWNALDLVLIIAGCACIFFNMLRAQLMNKKLKELLNRSDDYVDFRYIGFWEVNFNNGMAILVFLAWVKVFKYMSFNKTMTQLSTTLSRCAKDLLGFFIMFFIVFLAFTQLGYLLFGTQVTDFSTFNASFFTLFRIILGDFNFHQLAEANRILGPIYFMLFVFFVFFVLINMFLAIINDTYSEVKSDMAKQTDLFIMSDYLKQNYQRFMERFRPKEKKKDLEKMVSSGKSDNRLMFVLWKEDLKSYGFTDAEIAKVVDKFDVNVERSLDVKEQRRMLQELQKMKTAKDSKDKAPAQAQAPAQAPAPAADGKTEKDEGDDGEDTHHKEFISVDQFLTLSRRMDRMEGLLEATIQSVDSVLTSFSANVGTAI